MHTAAKSTKCKTHPLLSSIPTTKEYGSCARIEFLLPLVRMASIILKASILTTD